MNLHEYQAKEILEEYGIPMPRFVVAATVHDALLGWDRLNLGQAVVKIQVHAGGRGKAGGVRFARSKEELRSIASSLLGMKMVNQQTGEEGITAHQIIVSEPVDIAKEYYLGFLIDRAQGVPVMIASMEGGMEIEEVAIRFPEKIIKLPFGLHGQFRGYQMVRFSKFMQWSGSIQKQGMAIVQKLAQCFMEKDGALLEINPFVLSKDNQLLALDAKLSVDDNGLFRQKKIAAYYDPTQSSPQEVVAKQHDLSYIAMHGSIGCMVNGAGLAMATMDMIQLAGGFPANFLDVGGSASEDKIAEGFRIILSDAKVKAILINIFGGIMNCETLATGVIQAAKQLKPRLPILVRMEGTNVEKGKALFQKSGLKIETADDLEEAAQRVVALANANTMYQK